MRTTGSLVPAALAALVTLVTLAVLAACERVPARRAAPAGPTAPAAPPAPAAALVPGADLEGPVAPPARGKRSPGKGLLLGLGKDRAALPIGLPAPPRGAAASFVVAGGREGWVARVPEAGRLPTVAYGDGRVFVSGGFESTSMYALDARDGHMLWATQNLDDNGPTAPTYDDGRLIFNTESCTLFVLDGKTGRRLWARRLGDPTLAQPSLADGLIFASHPTPDGGMALSAYRLASGDEAWSRGLDAELLAAPVVAGDSVYAATLTGRLYRFERTKGKRLWSQPVRATTVPWLEGDELFLGRAQGGVEQTIVLAARDGRLVRAGLAAPAAWLREVPRSMDDWQKVWGFEGARPVVAGGVLYRAAGDAVSASDPETLEPYWSRAGTPAERSLGAALVAGPQVIVASRSGEVFGLDVDTGYTLWAYALGRPLHAQPVVARGWLYAATDGGEVVALHVGDATLDGWHMWGGGPGHNGAPSPATSVSR